ncbi:MAG: cysteine desulfurase family protein [Alphaproteobacteria bacterium]|nr:cysteine desulfurase family protein [Alphaproteobacteria bacterium]
MRAAVYLDHNATTPVLPEVMEAMSDALGAVGNPSSVHRFGRGARAVLERARTSLTALLEWPDAEVIFTSGGTESNNLAHHQAAKLRHFVTSVEHDSVRACVGLSEHLPVDADGVLDLEALDRRLSEHGAPAWLSVMLANNETGVIQPVAEAARIAHAHGALVHCDAVQAAGKMPVRWDLLGVDLLTLSAHKIGGPPGVGALLARPELSLSAQLRGGGQERGRRPGTENLPGIAGFGVAADVAAARAASYGEKVGALRDGLEDHVRRTAPHARIFGSGAARLANTTCLGLRGLAAETQVMALDLDGIAVSAGSACSSGKVSASHVLRAMGLDDAAAGSAIRVSLGWDTTQHEVDRFLESWSKLASRARDKASAA